MLSKQDMDRIKFEVFNDLEDELNLVTQDRIATTLDGLDALYLMTDCCIRIWSRLTKHATRGELPDE